MTNNQVLASIAIGFITAAACAQTPITRFGAIGDSLTDEYLEESYNYANSWTELLILHRSVSMGPTATDAAPGGYWGEPRRFGYEDNWARFGATTNDALASGQHTGLADGATTRNVSHAAMFIGGNDFAPWAFGTYSNIYNGVWTQTDTDFWIAQRTTNHQTMLDTLEPTGVDLVLMSVIDFSPMPFISQGDFTNAAQRDAVTDAIDQLADETRALADQYALAFLDMNAFARAIFGSNLQPRNTLDVGGVTIDLLASDTFSGTNPATGWVDDGIHPNTVIQGLWANAVISALNGVYGTDLALFTEEELVTNAGLTYAGIDTLPTEISDYTSYVTDYRCRANWLPDGVLDVIDLLAFLAEWFDGQTTADINADDIVDVLDMLAFLALWFEGC